MKHLVIQSGDTLTAETKALVGGKGFPLLTLAATGLPVPNLFAVTTDAYELFLCENGLHGKLATSGGIAAARSVILRSPIPQPLLRDIEAALKRLSGSRFAVRSSANVEDAADKSWAGEFDTYLNVPAAEVPSAIRQCWASIFSERVAAYAGTPAKLAAIKMGVVVQQSIESEVSGVCFTRDPLDADDDDLKIEAVFGLGEALVQGEVTPDRYIIERKRTILSEVHVTPQTTKYANDKAGGTRIVKIKPSYRQKLSGAEIKQLAQLALRIEALYGIGQDIEWSKDRSGLHILQSRPITTLVAPVHRQEKSPRGLSSSPDC